MITDREKQNWLRTQVRNAAFIAIGFSVLVFGAFVYYLCSYSDGWNWESYAAFGVGVAIGILLGIHRLVNPLRMAPLVRRKPLKMSEEEATAYLAPYWKRLPRYYCWIACVPYMATPLVMMAFTGAAAHDTGFLLKAALGGFFSSVSLCPGVFFAYVIYTWSEERGQSIGTAL